MKIIRVFVFMVLAGALIGCARAPQEMPLIPAWVEQGSGIFSAEGTIGIQGVGVSAGIEDNDLAVKVADRLALQAIGPFLKDLEKELALEYFKQHSQNPPVSTRQELDATLSQFTGAAEKYVRTVDHWRNPDTTSFFSLTRLDLEGMLAGLNQLETLDGDTKKFIRENTGPVLESILAARKK